MWTDTPALGGYGPGWKSLSEFILVRDSHTCQNCGSKSRVLAHHISGETWDMDEHNLITVCPSCNRRAALKAEAAYWIEFYTNKITEIYAARGGELVLPQVEVTV